MQYYVQSQLSKKRMREIKRIEAPVLFKDDNGGWRKYKDYTKNEKIVHWVFVFIFAGIGIGIFIGIKAILN